MNLGDDVSTAINVDIEHPFLSSDRKFNSINCHIPQINKAQRQVHLYSKDDYDSFNQKLADIVWNALLCINDIKRNCEGQKIYRTLLHKYITVKYIKPSQKHRGRNKIQINREITKKQRSQLI